MWLIKIFLCADATPTMALASVGQDSAADDATSVRQTSGAIRTSSVTRANAM